jgi:type I site-specific restriction endonuclease
MSVFLNGLKTFLGRRTYQKFKQYHFQSRFIPIKDHETQRHCYIHPSVVATMWETNTQDNSYKRPICNECFESA